MADILRTWGCLNCEQRFDAWEPNPECPKCGCVRVSWVPSGGHILGVAPGIDAEFRKLTDNFGMTDMASGGSGAKVKTSQPHVAPNSAPLHHFAPGFAAAVDPSRAMCVPTAAQVKANHKLTIGQALSPNGNFPSISKNTAVEAAHRPKP